MKKLIIWFIIWFLIYYSISVIYTIIKDNFNNWIWKQLNERNQYIEQLTSY